MFPKLQDSRAVIWGAAGIFAIGLTTRGYVLGDGLRRAKMAERTVTVRGVSERDVTADLVTWTIDFSHEGDDLAPVHESVNRQAQAVRSFFQRAGFRSDEIVDGDVAVSTQRQDKDQKSPDVLTVKRTIQLRTDNVD